MADVEDQSAVITIKVKLESTVEGDLSAGIDETERPDFFGQKGEDRLDALEKKVDTLGGDVSPELFETIQQEVQSSVDEFSSKFANEALTELDIDVDNIKDLVNTLDKQGIRQLTNFARNPNGFMESGFVKLLSAGGPYGALVVAIISAVIASPALFKAIVDTLGVKGGPLNQDFRYSLDEQENQQFSRMVQYSRLVGDDPVITVTTKGFVVGDADFNFNTLLDANIARTARIGLRDSALGVIDGI